MVHLWASGRLPQARIRVGEDYVEVGSRLKYLGLNLTSRFEAHFRYITPRAEGMAARPGRLLPNVGEPEGRVRRLFVGVVGSVVLYEARYGRVTCRSIVAVFWRCDGWRSESPAESPGHTERYR